VVVHALLAAGHVAEARSELESLRSRLDLDTPMHHARLDTLEGLLYRVEGDLPTAERVHHDALAAQHAGGWRPDLVHTLEALAGIAAANGSFVECARLTGAANALRNQMGYALCWPYERRSREVDNAAAVTALGEDGVEAAFAEGRSLDADAAVAYAQRARGERKRPTAGWQSLTPTELAVVRHVAAGLTNKQIGQELLMGAETVKTHLSHVYDKLSIRSRTTLAAAFTALEEPPPQP